MSCYEWESGTIKLPRSEFTRIRDIVRNAWNADLDKTWELLVMFRQNIPARDRKDLHSAIQCWLHGRDTTYWPETFSSPTWQSIRRRASLVGGLENEQIASMQRQMIRWDSASRSHRLARKSDLPWARGGSFTIWIGDAEIIFDHVEHTIHWGVLENNHACDHAHQHPIARLLFRHLNNVRWTSRTGGVIVGNNEYHRESESIGGGGNYVVMSFGPVGERQLASARY